MGTIVRLPLKEHAAHNPIIVEIEDTEVGTISIGVFAGTGYTLSKEVFNGRAIFDLSPILKRCFNDSVSFPGNPEWFADNNLGINYTAKIAGITYPFTALNAVRQIGESSGMNEQEGHFLTNFDRIKYYPGYDIQLCAMCFPTANYYNIAGGSQIHVELDRGVFSFWFRGGAYAAISDMSNSNVYLVTNGDTVITNELGEAIVIVSASTGGTERRIPVDTCCLPDNPFYVRWINDMGGWDYWMFSVRQSIDNSISDTVEFKPYCDDLSEANSAVSIIHLIPKKTITAGAEQLTENEFDVISRLIYSPKIQFYNPTTHKWLGLLLNEAEIGKDNSLAKQSLEFKFIAPQPQVQF